ncbi:MAG TPA: 16S rRNA (guanine(966)-N(2))-methyltransferase RsmD [Mariprofundaceae bacterium]|nr:16S rRNA (guanine(966)-N(2))-methyltransferase RsmD [Mariprofundaceae bacterium]
MRITAGTHRGRVLHVPDLPGLRPTPSRVREALFNILGDIEGWRILDLFAGSGIMSIEALSRGAESASAIEQHHKACQLMRDYGKQLGLESWQIMKGSLPSALSRIGNSSYELIFADPPYHQGIAEKIPQWLDEHNIHCQQLVIEESSKATPHWPENWTTAQSRRYGDTTLHFLTSEK